jgi:sugar phosphate isomerase/epimerase
MWGATWDIPTLIKNCRETGFEGVELRTEHKHGVEVSLSTEQRKQVARQFEDGGVKLMGLGTTCEFHSSDKEVLVKNIDLAKTWIKLAHDVGASGIKVRPNGLPKEIPIDTTLAQIGEAMQHLAEFGDGYGIDVRLEVHGKGTSELPHVRKIMDVARHPRAVVCWNCNETDRAGAGLEKNFELVADRIGTVHVHDLISDYPWRELFRLLKEAKFDGWTLLEEGNLTPDPLRVMKYYRLLWEAWTARGDQK